MGFRMKTGVDLPEEEQGIIFYKSRMYPRLCARDKKRIRDLCERCGGDYAPALLEYVTTDAGAECVCMRHFLSRATLYRCVKKYYESFEEAFNDEKRKEDRT